MKKVYLLFNENVCTPQHQAYRLRNSMHLQRIVYFKTAIADIQAAIYSVGQQASVLICWHMKQSDILRAESVGCCLDRKRLTCRTEDLAQRRCEISLSPLLLHLQSNRTEVNNCHCNTLAPPNGDRDTITTATDNNIIDFQSGWSGLRWKCLTMAPGPQRQNNGTRTTTSKQTR